MDSEPWLLPYFVCQLGDRYVSYGKISDNLWCEDCRFFLTLTQLKERLSDLNPLSITQDHQPKLLPTFHCTPRTLVEYATMCPPFGWETTFKYASPELGQLDSHLEGVAYYPLFQDVFRAFELTPLANVRVVIVGQDPYPQLANNSTFPRATGLSFSVRKGDAIPPSLAKIFREIRRTHPDCVLDSGDLTPWALQGVLLLNMALTYDPLHPKDHLHRWKGFLKKVVEGIQSSCKKVVWVLWGATADTGMTPFIGERALCLRSDHPAAEVHQRGRTVVTARGPFSGNDHFVKINQMVKPCIYWNTA